MKSPTSLLLALASSVHLTVCADITFPIVARGTAGEDSDYFRDLHASVMNVESGITTYSVGCSTTSCAGWDNLPSSSGTITVAIGPSTIDLQFTDAPILTTHSACAFQGSPPTAASCDITNVVEGRTTTISHEYHFTVPASPGDSGNWDMYNIMSATLKVIDGTASTTGTASVPTGTASTTDATTTTPTAGSAASSIAPSSGSAEVSTAFARETGVPAAKWVVGMGVAVGAMVAA